MSWGGTGGVAGAVGSAVKGAGAGALLGPIGSAVGLLGGAALSGKSSNKAANLQAKANADALAFERQKYEEEQALAKQQWEAQQAQEAPYRAMKYAFAKSLAAKYGINIPDMVTPTYPGGTATTMPASTPSPLGSTLTLGRLAGYYQPSPTQTSTMEPATPALMAPPVMTLGDLGRRT